MLQQRGGSEIDLVIFLYNLKMYIFSPILIGDELLVILTHYIYVVFFCLFTSLFICDKSLECTTLNKCSYLDDNWPNNHKVSGFHPIASLLSEVTWISYSSSYKCFLFYTDLLGAFVFLKFYCWYICVYICKYVYLIITKLFFNLIIYC